jgi:ArsR family transcriptional regulator, virulence genes transcriptional regulator
VATGGTPAGQVGVAAVDMRPLFKMHAEVCQALSSEHRLAIMYGLKEGERRVTDIADDLGIPVHNVSQHLRILRQALLVRPRKEGQTVYYSIANPKFMEACALMQQALLEEHQAEGTALHAAAGVLDPVAALYGTGIDSGNTSVRAGAAGDEPVNNSANSHLVANA